MAAHVVVVAAPHYVGHRREPAASSSAACRPASTSCRRGPRIRATPSPRPSRSTRAKTASTFRSHAEGFRTGDGQIRASAWKGASALASRWPGPDCSPRSRVCLLGRQATPSGGDVGRSRPISTRVIREAAAGGAGARRHAGAAAAPGLGGGDRRRHVRDLTTEELAFRHAARRAHRDRAACRKGGGELRRLLRLPPDASFALPMIARTHVFLDGGKSHVVTVVSVEPRQRADELVGMLAVRKQLDTAADRAAAGGARASTPSCGCGRARSRSPAPAPAATARRPRRR